MSMNVFEDVQIYVYLWFSTRNQIIAKVCVKGRFLRFDSFEFVLNFVKIRGLEGLWDEMPIDIRIVKNPLKNKAKPSISANLWFQLMCE